MKILSPKIGTSVCLAGLAAFLLPVLSTQASVVTTANTTITTYVSSATGGWYQVSDSDLGLQLDLRARLRGSGTDYYTGNGNYSINVNGTSATYGDDWSIDFSVNTSGTGKSITGSGFTFVLVADNGLYTQNLANLTDNLYGNSSTTKSTAITANLFTYNLLNNSFSIMQNSEPMLKLKTSSGSTWTTDVLGLATTGHTFTLYAYNAAGEVVLTDKITVDGGYGPVPEPSTIMAGAMLLLPFGIGAFRSLRKSRKA